MDNPETAPLPVTKCMKCKQHQFCVKFEYLGFVKGSRDDFYLCYPCHRELAKAIEVWVKASLE